MTNSQINVNNKFFGLEIPDFSIYISKIRKLISQRILLIEFNYQYLIIAEAKLSDDQIQIYNLIKVSLPEEALDRGIPTDPEKISSLLKTICKENNIYSDLCYVVISTEAVFNKVIYLPSQLKINDAREFANQPNSSVEIPIPLGQTDFDIQETSFKDIIKNSIKYKQYYLTSVPKELIDKLIESIRLSELKLGYLDVPYLSFQRLLDDELISLPDNHFAVVLELLPDVSYAYLIDKKSTLSTHRLPSIRNFPQPSNAVLAQKRNNNYLTLEKLIVSQNDYLPISELDLKILIKELKSLIKNFILENNEYFVDRIYVTGLNSSYPEITELISNKTDVKTFRLSPITNKNFGNLNLPDNIFSQEISRVLGLSLSLLKNDVIDDINSVNDYKLIRRIQKDIENKNSKNLQLKNVKNDQPKDIKKIVLNQKTNSEKSLKNNLNIDSLNTVEKKSNEIFKNTIDLKDSPKSSINKLDKETLNSKINKNKIKSFSEALKEYESEKAEKSTLKNNNLSKKENQKNSNNEKESKKTIKDEPLTFSDE